MLLCVNLNMFTKKFCLQLFSLLCFLFLLSSSRNFLYVYRQSLDFRSVNHHNIGIKVQFLKGEDPNSREDCLPAIYGQLSGPAFMREWWCLVNCSLMLMVQLLPHVYM